MLYYASKVILSALVIALASEVARRSPFLGGIIVSLPLVAILSMIWLWRETADIDRIAAFSISTFWFVIPTLPMFLLFPWLLRQEVGFWPSILLACALTIALYLAMAFVLSRFGIRL